MDAASAANKGYLRENFRLFHLRDRRELAVEPHYHEFDKAVLFFSGDVSYTVEGATYRPRAGDVLFVRHHDVHRTLIGGGETYERAVLWATPDFLAGYGCGEGRSLESCFELAHARRESLYHPAPALWGELCRLTRELERDPDAAEFGAELLRQTCFLQLAVALNRCALAGAPERPENCDPQIEAALRYISAHLADDLSVERLASLCFLSRYYFMRRFRESTGYTVHGYVRVKRLTAASERLLAGEPVTRVLRETGFSEYSTFLRAFRAQFGVSPGEYARSAAAELQSRYTE